MVTVSSTQSIPSAPHQVRHIAMIMDGNGRWAKKRFLPRVAGHKRGVESIRAMVRACLDRNVEYLTLFAFSSENWRRPIDEVTFLMGLFVKVLDYEVRKLHANNVRIRVVGDLDAFNPQIRQGISDAHSLTEGNTQLNLTICANYGGRWDLLQAFNRMSVDQPGKAGTWNEAELAPYLSLSFAPEPDLFVRTGGEQRISNFLLWQLAYTELYFTEALWPDFRVEQLDAALNWFSQRERRFGQISEQLPVSSTCSEQE